MSFDRQWMYNRISGGYLNIKFVEGVQVFVQFAISQPEWTDGPRIRCPCSMCKNRKFFETENVKLHLVKKGFVADYYEWRFHGETTTRRNYEWGEGHTSAYATEPPDPYHTMVRDAGDLNLDFYTMEESPNLIAKKLYEMLQAVDQAVKPRIPVRPDRQIRTGFLDARPYTGTLYLIFFLKPNLYLWVWPTSYNRIKIPYIYN